MDIDAILKSVEGWGLAGRIRDSLYLFPFLESLHVIALAMVFGTITVIDLRLLGKASTQRPFKLVAADILKWTWVAFALTILTGALMFVTNAGVYYHNWYFRAKMALLAVAGLNMLAFELTAGRTMDRWNEDRSAPRAGRVVAVVSLVVWVAVIFAGRLIGFNTTRKAAPAPAATEINFDDLFQAAPADGKDKAK